MSAHSAGSSGLAGRLGGGIRTIAKIFLGLILYAIIFLILARWDSWFGELWRGMWFTLVQWISKIPGLGSLQSELPRNLEASSFGEYEWVFWLMFLVSTPIVWLIGSLVHHLWSDDPADVYLGRTSYDVGRGSTSYQPRSRAVPHGGTTVTNIHHHYPARNANDMWSSIFKGALLVIMFMLVVHATANVFYPIYQGIVLGPENWTKLEVRTGIYEGGVTSLGQVAQNGVASFFGVILSALKWTIILIGLVVGLPMLLLFIRGNRTVWIDAMHRIPGATAAERMAIVRTVMCTIYAFMLIAVFLWKL